MYSAVTIDRPSTRARGMVRPGSRTSPASLLASHQPASEMKAPIKPPARACGSGSEPGRCAQNGSRFDQSPRPEANPQVARNTSRPIFRPARARRTPEPIAAPSMLTPASTAIAATATPLSPQPESGTRCAA